MSNLKSLPKMRWLKNEFGQDRLQYLDEELVMSTEIPHAISHINYVYKDVPIVEN